MKKTVLREEFLKEFIKAVITEKVREQKETAQMEMVQIPQLVEPPIKVEHIEIIAPPTIFRKKTIIKHPMPQAAPQQLPPVVKVAPMPPKIAPAIIPIAQPKPVGEGTTLARIEQFLSDPAVLSVECTGPGKPLLVNRGGAIQAAPLTISSEEINNIMREISDRTRIPIIPGLFKAVFGNYTITAVISELTGTRFVLQKRYLPAKFK